MAAAVVRNLLRSLPVSFVAVIPGFGPMEFPTGRIRPRTALRAMFDGRGAAAWAPMGNSKMLLVWGCGTFMALAFCSIGAPTP